jgi:hypothetical protein
MYKCLPQELKLKMQSQQSENLHVVVSFESENYLLLIPAEPRVEDFEARVGAKLGAVERVDLPQPAHHHITIRHFHEDFQNWFALTQDSYSMLKGQQKVVIELAVSRVDPASAKQSASQQVKQVTQPVSRASAQVSKLQPQPKPSQQELPKTEPSKTTSPKSGEQPPKPKVQVRKIEAPPVGLHCPQITITNIVGGKRTVVPPNTRRGIPIKTSLFEGEVLVLFRTQPLDPHYRHLFEGEKGKSKRFILQVRSTC